MSLFDEDAIDFPTGTASWVMVEAQLNAKLEKESSGSAIILFAGREILRYRGIPEYIEQMQRMTLLCRKRGVTPILVALPDFGDKRFPFAQKAAQALKQMALQRKITVIDLYFAQIAEEKSPGFLLEKEGIQWRKITPDGKRWLSSHWKENGVFP